jgi:hypothetical protein
MLPVTRDGVLVGTVHQGRIVAYLKLLADVEPQP